jgi:hypothetical protein
MVVMIQLTSLTYGTPHQLALGCLVEVEVNRTEMKVTTKLPVDVAEVGV